MYKVSETLAYVELKLHPDECADGLWLLNVNENDAPLALFIECKSARIKPDGKTFRSDKFSEFAVVKLDDSDESSYKELPDNGKQARRVSSWVSQAPKLFPNRTNGSLAEALAAGNFIYVYINTRRDDTFTVGDHILHIGKKYTEQFLSFYKNIYYLHRSTADGSHQEIINAELQSINPNNLNKQP